MGKNSVWEPIMSEQNGMPDLQSLEALLLRRIADLEATLSKTTFERDKARKMVVDLCDFYSPEDRELTPEAIERLRNGPQGPSISEIVKKFETTPEAWADRKLAFCRNNWFGTVTVSGSLS